ncbi:hypothetical protein PR048_014573 [Dryococelus australis]|uniref:Uncharacterized protein n=1 Tax=Dryococelus australis TaxID=614101 RepID=A0ABQ9HET6_9NEOP|nr:hypothetical protein PR048_014573 [Dryococelus australis]
MTSQSAGNVVAPSLHPQYSFNTLLDCLPCKLWCRASGFRYDTPPKTTPKTNAVLSSPPLLIKAISRLPAVRDQWVASRRKSEVVDIGCSLHTVMLVGCCTAQPRYLSPRRCAREVVTEEGDAEDYDRYDSIVRYVFAPLTGRLMYPLPVFDITPLRTVSVGVVIDWLLTRSDSSSPAKANRARFPAMSLPGFSHVGIVPDDAAGRRFFSGISRFPVLCIPVPFHSRLVSPIIGSRDLDRCGDICFRACSIFAGRRRDGRRRLWSRDVPLASGSPPPPRPLVIVTARCDASRYRTLSNAGSRLLCLHSELHTPAKRLSLPLPVELRANVFARDVTSEAGSASIQRPMRRLGTRSLQASSLRPQALRHPIVQPASRTLHCLILAVADFPSAGHLLSPGTKSLILHPLQLNSQSGGLQQDLQCRAVPSGRFNAPRDAPREPGQQSRTFLRYPPKTVRPESAARVCDSNPSLPGLPPSLSYDISVSFSSTRPRGRRSSEHRLLTHSPAGSPASSEHLAACSSQSDTRFAPRASRSQSEYGHAHIKGIVTTRLYASYLSLTKYLTREFVRKSGNYPRESNPKSSSWCTIAASETLCSHNRQSYLLDISARRFSVHDIRGTPHLDDDTKKEKASVAWDRNAYDRWGGGVDPGRRNTLRETDFQAGTRRCPSSLNGSAPRKPAGNRPARFPHAKIRDGDRARIAVRLAPSAATLRGLMCTCLVSREQLESSARLTSSALVVDVPIGTGTLRAKNNIPKLKELAWLQCFSPYLAEERGSYKGYTGTCYESAIASTRRAVNWRAVFS